MGAYGVEAYFPVKFFRALGEPNRLKVFFSVAQMGRACTVSEVASCCSTDFSVTSRHLVLLRDAGILSSRKEGRCVYYHVNCAEATQILRDCAGAIESFACDTVEDSSAEAEFISVRENVSGNPPGGVPGIY
jgi:DNA-binding transcriptional ArsR family regulator